MAVDIIIPIYNAYEDLVKCVSSVLKYTDLNKNRLILVNDASPDARIKIFLDKIEGLNVIVHHSKDNGGFSASVNIGMKYSLDNDVLLLNSDTIVTSNWLKNISKCAYMENNIATVIPLSNSATLASIPIIGQDNPVPSHISIEEYAELVERYSLRKYPQITVAVGFCMFIKRNVLDEIGYFDAETFGRGYGEENDFCCRAELMGYKHVLCDDTFVYHKGTGSFLSEQKRALIKEHVEILEERYPASMRNNHMFCMSKPYQEIRDNVILHLDMFNKKKNILYVLHADFRNDSTNNVGGTQLHVKDLMHNLSEDYNIYVLVKEKKKYRLSCYIGKLVYTFEFKDENVNVYPLFRDKKERFILENILSAFRIDLIHIHHISSMSLEIYYVAEELDIPVITSIHDFYTLCPSFFLYSTIEKQICSGQISGACDVCLKEQLKVYNGKNYLEKWRSEMERAMNKNKVIVFPSESAREKFYSIYPIDIPSEVIPHGINFSEYATYTEKKNVADAKIFQNIESIDLLEGNSISGWMFWKEKNSEKVKVRIQVIQDQQLRQEIIATKLHRQDVDDFYGKTGTYIYSGFYANIFKELLSDGEVDLKFFLDDERDTYLALELKHIPVKGKKVKNRIKVAFVGGLSIIKGSEEAHDLIKSGNDIDWFIFGSISPDTKLASLELPNLHKFGAYNRDEIITLLKSNKIDLVCILSKCSETFCYTLSETLVAHIPVIAYDIGAVGERLKKDQLGVLVPVGTSIKDMLRIIREIYEDDKWNKIRERLKKYVHKTDREMANEYCSLYKRFFLVDPQYDNCIDTRMIKAAYRDKQFISV